MLLVTASRQKPFPRVCAAWETKQWPQRFSRRRKVCVKSARRIITSHCGMPKAECCCVLVPGSVLQWILPVMAADHLMTIIGVSLRDKWFDDIYMLCQTFIGDTWHGLWRCYLFQHAALLTCCLENCTSHQNIVKTLSHSIYKTAPG